MNAAQITPARAPRSAKSRADDQTSRPLTRQPVNVGDYERGFSAIAGALLTGVGLSDAIAKPSAGNILMTLVGGGLVYRGLTGHCHMYSALGFDTACHAERTAVPAQQGCKVEKSLTIARSPAELYAFWRDVENLQQVMKHVDSIEAIDRTRSHWVASGPLGRRYEWDAEIFNDEENSLIAWRSLAGGDIDTAGSVRFRELSHGRGTGVSVSLKYQPPAGKLGAMAAWILGMNERIEEDLRDFKCLMETGELPTVDGQSSGREQPEFQA